MTPLADVLREVEATLEGADLGLSVLDRLTLLGYADERLHRGVAVFSSATTSGEARNRDVAIAVDAIQVQLGYRLRPLDQRASRDEALVLGEQIVSILTSRTTAWGSHLAWSGTRRKIQGEDGQWLITTQTYRTRRQVRLGGGG